MIEVQFQKFNSHLSDHKAILVKLKVEGNLTNKEYGVFVHDKKQLIKQNKQLLHELIIRMT